MIPSNELYVNISLTALTDIGKWICPREGSVESEFGVSVRQLWYLVILHLPPEMETRQDTVGARGSTFQCAKIFNGSESI